MRPRGWLAVIAVLAGCRISDLSFHLPSEVGSDGGSNASTGGGDAALDGDAAPGPVFASCVDLQAQCGTPGGSCCESPVVPGGMFFRDFDVAGDSLSGDKNNPATISSFRLDKYDVTVARFRKFVMAGMGTQASPPVAGTGGHAQLALSGWDASWNPNLEQTTADLIMAFDNCSSDQTWHHTPSSAQDENRPMNCITWYEAMAFCIWDGGYLPTEAEWDYAAMGGDQQRAYPWSSPPGDRTIDAMHASYCPGCPPSTTNCTGDGMSGCTVSDIVPVGSLPKGDGRWGQSDLAGNVYQWLLDWSAPYKQDCMDCGNVMMSATDPPTRVTRGGAFVYDKDVLRGGVRSNGYLPMRNYIYGFRCARPM